MDLYKAIQSLYDEKRRLDRLIESLEALRESGGLDQPVVKKRRGRKSMSADERSKVSERMRNYWAARRAQQTRAPAEQSQESKAATAGS